MQIQLSSIIAFVFIALGAIAVLYLILSRSGQKSNGLAERAERVVENNKRLADQQRKQAEAIGSNDSDVNKLADQLDGSVEDSKQIADGLRSLAEAVERDKSNIDRARQVLDGIQNRNGSSH